LRCCIYVEQLAIREPRHVPLSRLKLAPVHGTCLHGDSVMMAAAVRRDHPVVMSLTATRDRFLSVAPRGTCSQCKAVAVACRSQGQYVRRNVRSAKVFRKIWELR
jgi:hypothetical protein